MRSNLATFGVPMKPLSMRFFTFLFSSLAVIILFSCNKQPTACIIESSRIVGVGETIEFGNCSNKGRTFEWDLGDGTTKNSSTENTITHVYYETGSYKVELCAYSKKEDKSSCASVNIQVVNYPLANFSFDSAACTNPCAVQFTNSSTYANTFFWDFGDGTTSTEENPSHEYTSGELFTVTLTASNQYGNSTSTAEINVIEPYPPSAVFTLTEDGDFTPKGVQFNNLTSNGTEYEWNFGDGFSSSEFEPYHIFNGSGSYLVTLKASNIYGSDTYSQFVSVPGTPTTVRIVEMQLTGINNTDPNGVPWDADCDNSPADVYFVIADNQQVLFASTGFVNNTTFPAWYQVSTGFPFTLSPIFNQYYISLWDKDEVGCEPDELMEEFSFTPSSIMPTDGSPYPTEITFDNGAGMVFTAYLSWN